MNLPANLPHHVHISEREGAHRWPNGAYDDSAWEDCGWDSLTMVLRDAGHPELPATHPESELLRSKVMGPLGATTPAQLLRAAAIVAPDLHFTGVAPSQLWGALEPGRVAVVSGQMGNFPTGHPLRRWSPGFIGRHSVYVARFDGSEGVWWDDPLANSTILRRYNGQFAGKADLLKFVHDFDLVSLVLPIPTIAYLYPDSAIRLLDPKTCDYVKPSSRSYILGKSIDSPCSAHPGPAHLVWQGRWLVLLDRNFHT